MRPENRLADGREARRDTAQARRSCPRKGIPGRVDRDGLASVMAYVVRSSSAAIAIGAASAWSVVDRALVGRPRALRVALLLEQDPEINAAIGAWSAWPESSRAGRGQGIVGTENRYKRSRGRRRRSPPERRPAARARRVRGTGSASVIDLQPLHRQRRADEVSEIGPILAKPRQAHAAQRLSGPQ